MEIEKEAYNQAIKILDMCSTKNGFFAAYPGYDAVWARDSMIISLGASLIDDKYKETFKQSLITLANNQSENGQIPNAVDTFSKERKPHVDYKTLDSSLWFIIGHHIYKNRYNDDSLFKKHEQKIKKALFWISMQDSGEDYMPEQQPTSDWFDAFPHRYGHTINTQALYYKCLILQNQNQLASKVNYAVNKNEDVSLWNGRFYLPWRWKNHNKYQEKGQWFDSLGNLLAIIFELSSKEQTEKILKHIKKEKIDSPFPIKAISPPIYKGSKDWQDYFLDCEAGIPFHYSNGGIWTFIGGFYVLALIKAKKYQEAKIQLKQLAIANMKNNGNFAEWLNGKTGEVGNSQSGKESYQGWNAGAYILAYESLKQKKVLI